MVNNMRAKLYYIPHVFCVPFLIFLYLIVFRGNTMKCEFIYCNGSSITQSNRVFFFALSSFCDEIPVCLRDDKFDRWVVSQNRYQRFGVQMVCMIVARGYD